MKKIIKTCNKPIVLIGTLIATIAVVLAKLFMTKGEDEEE